MLLEACKKAQNKMSLMGDVKILTDQAKKMREELNSWSVGNDEIVHFMTKKMKTFFSEQFPIIEVLKEDLRKSNM